MWHEINPNISWMWIVHVIPIIIKPACVINLNSIYYLNNQSKVYYKNDYVLRSIDNHSLESVEKKKHTWKFRKYLHSDQFRYKKYELVKCFLCGILSRVNCISLVYIFLAPIVNSIVFRSRNKESVYKTKGFPNKE